MQVYILQVDVNTACKSNVIKRTEGTKFVVLSVDLHISFQGIPSSSTYVGFPIWFQGFFVFPGCVIVRVTCGELVYMCKIGLSWE